MADTPQSDSPTYTEPTILPSSDVVRLETIYGVLPQTTAAPTFTPRSFREGFAIDTTNNIFYFYDFVDNAWIAANVTDAHIRGLFSATAPIAYDNSTGIISMSPYVAKAYLAGEAISTGDAVCAAPYQSDGGVKVDTTAHGHQTVTSLSVGITVANNANRIMVVVLSVHATTIASVQYAGVSMTAIDTNTVGNLTTNTYYLVAPTTGTNNFTATIGSASVFTCYAVYSLYNASQTGQPTNNHQSASSDDLPLTVTLAPSEAGDFVIGYGVFDSNGFVTQPTVSFSNNTMSEIGTSQITQIVADNGQAVTTANQSTTNSASGSNPNNITGLIIIKPQTAVVYGYVKQATTKAKESYTTPTSLPFRSTAFIGFALAGAAEGASVTVIVNGIVTLSGLLPAALYYLASTEGTITSGVTTRKVGIAVSTTDLVITNEP